ncbi:MAG TPA: hypothetical protein DHW15_04605 [Bacteroidetes bacterium]|jgi:dienelactone hydrolase|nr:hypothetical protein [Bacteroidota bacterium]
MKVQGGIIRCHRHTTIFMFEITSMKNKSIWLWVLLFSTIAAKAQFPGIGHSTITFNDPSRPGRLITTEIYYPALSNGDEVPVASGPKFPFVIMSHGFLMTFDAYANIWEELVPLGYIVVLPTTAGELLPDHEQYARDIAFLSNNFSKLSKFAGSLFYNRIRNKCAAMGHSMGGGATLLAASYPNKITTTITFAAAETSPSAIAACPSMTAPSLVFATDDDCVTPPAVHQIPMFEALGGPCNTYIEIAGGTHCQFADYNFTCSLGELFCASDISRNTQHNLVNTFMVPWLQRFLKNSTAAYDSFNDLLLSTEGITYVQDCPLRLPADESDEESLEIYPNPARDAFQLLAPEAGYVMVTGIDGKTIWEGNHAGNWQTISTAHWSAGMYKVIWVGEQEQSSATLLIAD